MDRLIFMVKPILYETHMHTPLCRHAVGDPEEYAAVAEARGLRGIVVTCHNPIPDGWSASVRMQMEEFDQYLALVERARKEWVGRVDIRLGLESDYAPGMEPWLKELHGRAELHHVLGSVHPQVPDYYQKYFKDDWQAYQKLYFEHLAMAAESGLFDTLAHPDLVKNLAPQEWVLERIWKDVERSLDRIAATGICMELNTSGLNKAIPEMNPGPEILKAMCQRNIPVVIGADAHSPKRVADHYEEAMDQLEIAGYSEIQMILERHRKSVDLAEARASLRLGVPGIV